MLEEKIKQLALYILQTSRNELGQLFPYLDGAMDHLRWAIHTGSGTYVDGRCLYISAPQLLALYEQNPAAVRRGYLHMLLHCLFLHLFDPTHRKDPRWNLACDIAVEQILEQLGEARLASHAPVRSACLELLGDRQESAEHIVQLLEEGFFPYSPEELEAAFSFDDHHPWGGTDFSDSRGCWEQLLLDAARHKSGKGRRGSAPGSGEEEIHPPADARQDYRNYLRRFTIPREEVELDTESFDYAFYHFGMTQYGSMPLIEPLEYKEVHRLEELVIAIDTSGSCSAETVSRFLGETCEILSRQENFFRKMKVYFIQCDCIIQDVRLIRSREDWLEYAAKVRIRGRSGTSFTPVFDYVKDLRERKELKNLKALFYFTDGDGAYPTQAPDYETTFLLLKEACHPELIPPWANYLVI